MIVFLDTSALFKLYAAEPGANSVLQPVSSMEVTCTHLIAYAETCAGFAKAVKLRRITSVAGTGYRREPDRDWERFGVLKKILPS